MVTKEIVGGRPMLKRSGIIYSEFYNNGKHPARNGLRNSGVISKSFRWVGEIVVMGKRFRYRSTNLSNVKWWVEMMVNRYPYYYNPKSWEYCRKEIAAIRAMARRAAMRNRKTIQVDKCSNENEKKRDKSSRVD